MVERATGLPYTKGFRKGQERAGKGQWNGVKGNGPTREKAKWPSLQARHPGVVMLSLLFPHKRVSPTPGAAPPLTEPISELTRPESAASLLATPRRKRLLEHIWQRTALSRKQFASLYLTPLERYAELVQLFPGSESHHHAYLGGMLDHGLEIVGYALKLRQSYLLPTGTTPEDQAAQSEVWTAAVGYAALLHDLGKVAVDLHVELSDGNTWHPWHGPPQRPYRFRYRTGREYRLHGAATGLLYHRILDRDILDWLSGYPEAWSALLYVLAGQYAHAGVLGELVTQADRASVAQALGGDPAKAIAAPRHALQRKLLEGLRYLLKTELKLNQPQASDGWLTQDALWLVSKTVSDKLRAHLLSHGFDGIPASNTAVFNVLQEHGILQPTAEGKAIWKAIVTSDAGWSHSFTFLKLSPAMIWEAAERPTPFAGSVQVESEDATDQAPTSAAVPVDNEHPIPAIAESATSQPAADSLASLLDLLDTNSGSAAPAPPPAPAPPAIIRVGSARSIRGPHQSQEEPSDVHFVAWLRQGVQTRRIIINDAKALVHTVAGTAYLVSPGVFQRYAQEHPQVAHQAKREGLSDWQWIQKRFEKLRLHRKQDSGLNIWTCEVTGPRKSRRLHGYLLSDASVVFDEQPCDNPYLRLVEQ